MSTLAVNSITDANAGNTATINGMTPTADSLQGFRNRILNGDCRIDQRNAGALINPAVTGYTIDRWGYQGSQTSKGTIGQNAGSVTPPTGFTNYLGFTSTSAYSVLSTDVFFVRQRIEGFNTADLAWGTANAKTVTLSFWVRSSLTGTFGGSVYNNAADRNYPFSYSISAANTWEYKTVTIPGDTTGTWLTTSGIGVQVLFGLGYGSTYSGTAGAWTSSAHYSVTGAVSVVGTNGATWYITGVQLEVGSVASPFERRPYGTELSLCQRYFLKNLPGATDYPFTNAAIFSTTLAFGVYAFPVTMRATPSVSFNSANDLRLLYNGVGQNSSAATGSNGTPSAIELLGTYSGLTSGQAAWMRAAGSASFVAFSAEL